MIFITVIFSRKQGSDAKKFSLNNDIFFHEVCTDKLCENFRKKLKKSQSIVAGL